MILIHNGLVRPGDNTGDGDIQPVLDPPLRSLPLFRCTQFFLLYLQTCTDLVKTGLMLPDGISQGLYQSIFQSAAADEIIKVGIPETTTKLFVTGQLP